MSSFNELGKGGKTLVVLEICGDCHCSTSTGKGIGTEMLA
jgi:hypothetical protein